MVGHRDGGHPGIHGALGVIDAHHALEHERPAPVLAQPGDVLPGRRWGAHPLPVGGEEGRPGLTAATLVRGGQRRRAKSLGPVQEPRRAHKTLRRHLDRGEDVHLLRDLRAAPVPAVRETPVGGRDQADRTGGTGPIRALGDRVPATEPVDLEEGLGVDGDDVLDGLAGERRQPHCCAARGGGAGDGHLAVGVDRLHTGR